MRLKTLIQKGIITYRLARLIATEDGPYDIFKEIRARLGAYDYGADGRPLTMTGKLISCPFCTGLWVAIVVYSLPDDNSLSDVFQSILCIAGIQTLIQSYEPEHD